MRIAILSDIHGNLTALEAVLADLCETAPDLVIHGGDLADVGSRPTEVIDRISALGWQGVLGNGDEMLSRPESLEEFARHSSAPAALWKLVREMATFTRASLGEERLSWLGELPPVISLPGLAVVHASPETCWKAPAADATDAGLERAYGPLDRAVVVFGHTHGLPFAACMEASRFSSIVAVSACHLTAILGPATCFWTMICRRFGE